MLPDDPRRANLEKLASFLERAVPPPQFGMSMYVVANIGGYRMSLEPYEAVTEVYTQCGTVACALGHGPLAGIKPKSGDTWDTYSKRVFVDVWADDQYQVTQDWKWLFSGLWSVVDDTPKGAAARIRYYLEHGVPDDVDGQIDGDTPLCYKVDATT